MSSPPRPTVASPSRPSPAAAFRTAAAGALLPPMGKQEDVPTGPTVDVFSRSRSRERSGRIAVIHTRVASSPWLLTPNFALR